MNPTLLTDLETIAKNQVQMGDHSFDMITTPTALPPSVGTPTEPGIGQFINSYTDSEPTRIRNRFGNTVR